ncbi:MAG: bifunctional adenosylcobinamide kinase/adenosylcobinamide-phosphate guanylyltransferase [bacterium]|nr:bifunctional adenosylcobinamide kinase/adenosylcobinamide-phosphate guanylyltransferase [bacterium]
MGAIVFITGGARSGKSWLAEEFAKMWIEDSPLKGVLGGRSRFAKQANREIKQSPAARVCYLATARPVDDEMKARIEQHKQKRPKDWYTVEEPFDLAPVLSELKGTLIELVIIDCVTVWVSNMMETLSGKYEEIRAGILNRTDELIKECFELEDVAVVVVGNEVGSAIVPENPLARQFRDINGEINQRFARAARLVYLMVSGIPVKIKGGQREEQV